MPAISSSASTATSAKTWYGQLRAMGGVWGSIYQAFDRIVQAVAALERSVELLGGGGSISGAINTLGFVQVIAADYNVPDPVGVPSGSLILYVIRQDGVGGHAITWPASFQGMPDADTVDTTAGTQLTALVYKETAIRVYPVGVVMSGVEVS